MTYLKTIFLIMAVYLTGIATGYYFGKKDAFTKTEVQVLKQDQKQIKEKLNASQVSGNSIEVTRRKIDLFYKELDKDARNDASDRSDDYVLPDERLQRWRSANTGPDRCATTSKPDTGTTTFDAAGKRKDQDSGRKPQRSDATVPSAGGAAVRVDPMVGH